VSQVGPKTHISSSPAVSEKDECGDVVFRFSLRPCTIPQNPEAALESFFRAQIGDLLRVVDLTFHGQSVLVDGFRFINDTGRHFELWPAEAGDEDSRSDNPDEQPPPPAH